MREGECRRGCGACCRFLILQVNPAYMEPERRKWIEMHGIRLYERDGGAWAVINAQCQHLTTEGDCGIFGQPERPEACTTFPVVQHDVTLIDEWAGQPTCSYRFVEDAG